LSDCFTRAAGYTKVIGRCQSNAVTEPVEVPALRRRLHKSIPTQPQHAHKVCIRAQRVKHPNKPYSFEVIKIELLDFIESNSSISTANDPNSQGGLIINTANILQNVEKSYDKGKLLLEESKKSDAWDAIFRRY